MVVASKTDWKQARTVRLLTLSATQVETADICIRKWWFKSVRRLPEPITASRAYGTVMHAVIDRFLSADDLGRDKSGRLVDLYPEGWTKAVNRFNPSEVEGEVSPAEADQIKRLISAAIQEGVLERTLDRVVEQPFRETITQEQCEYCLGRGRLEGDLGSLYTCPTCKGDGKGVHIQITGFIDLMDHTGVTDHKSIKRMRYAKSREKLRHDIQLRIYAWFWLKLLGEEAPFTLTLRHNQFCKDPDDMRVRKTEVDISANEIRTFWDELTERAKQMDAFRTNAESWHDLPDPRSGAEACNAYGGCPFRSICGGQETEEQYEERISRWAALQETSQQLQLTNTQTPQETNPMTLLDRLNQLSAASAATSTTPVGVVGINPPVAAPGMVTMPAPIMAPPMPVQQAPLPVAQPLPVAAPTPVPQTGPAMQPNIPTMQFIKSTQPNAVPWAVDACGACKGWGFNTRGAPCPICRVNAKKCTPALPDSELFTLTPTGDGRVYWELKANTTIQGASPYMSAGVPVTVEAKTAPIQPPQPLPVATPQVMPQVQVVPQPVPTPAPTINPIIRQAADSVSTTYGTSPTPTPQAAPTSVEAPAPPQEDTEAAAKRRGRPKKSFILLNGYVTKGEERLNSGRGVHHLTDVLRKYGAMLAAQYIAAGKLKAGGTYHDINAFDRRDEIAKIAESIAESFSSDVVVADLAVATPDIKALFEALDPWAGMTMVGSRM